MKFAVIDTETSGLPDYKRPADADGQPRLAQLSIIIADEALQPIERQNYYVRPDGWSMDPAATAVNGLTDEFLNEHGLPIVEVLNYYQCHILNGAILVSFGAQFDLKVMRGELRRAGLDDLFEKTANICVMRGSAGHIPKANGKGGWPSLAEAMDFLQFDPGKAHKAENDSEGALRVAQFLLEKGVLPEAKVHHAKNHEAIKNNY